MGKVKITWDEDVKKELHRVCEEYFSTVPIEKLENFFRIVLFDTSTNVKDDDVKNKINDVKVNVNSYDKEPDNLTIDEVNLIKDIQYDINGKTYSLAHSKENVMRVRRIQKIIAEMMVNYIDNEIETEKEKGENIDDNSKG